VRFLTPLAFAWLGIAVPVVALYFLKLRRRKMQVSSTWLWVRSVQDFRVNAPFQRLRKSLLLLLQLLLIAIATFALTQPIGRTTPPEDKRWVFLIDRSASMQMKDVAPSRLDKAKETAKQLLSGAGPRDEAMVIAFSNRAQIMTPFTGSRADAERAIDAIRPADSATRAQEAFRIAVSAVQPYKNREIVILSDGRLEALQGAEGIDVRYVPIGGEPRNAAITAIDVRRPGKTDEPWTVFVQLDNSYKEAQELPVELYVNTQLKAVKKVQIAAATSGAVIFEVARPTPEVVQVQIAMEDDLAVDNSAWFVVKQERARILLASAGNFFLEKAVTHVKDVEAFRTSDIAAASLGEYDAVVLDQIMPDNLPDGRYLILGATPKWEDVKQVGTLDQPAVMDWSRRHPVARGVNFSDIFIKSAPKLSLPGYATPVVEAADAPLVYAWEKGRTRAVVVVFNVLDSDWPLRLSFPLFLANVFDWLRDEGKSHPKPGEPLRLRLAEGEKELEVTTPARRTEKLAGEPGRDVVFGDTDSVGLYGVKRKDVARPVALNLLDPQESNGTVAKELRIGGGKVAAVQGLGPIALPLWKWFAAGVLALLLIEWAVYHRRLEL